VKEEIKEEQQDEEVLTNDETSKLENTADSRESKTETQEDLEKEEDSQPTEEISIKKEPTFPYNSDDMSFTTEKVKPKKKKSGLLKYFLIVAFIAFFIGLAFMAGFDYFQQRNNFNNNNGLSETSITPTVTTSSSPSISPESSASATSNLSAFSISILNGSGITGEASKLKTSLVTAGFTVNSVGNADNSDYKNTKIYAKKKVVAAYLNQLKAILKKSYVLDPVADYPKTASGESDLIITIGATTAK